MKHTLETRIRNLPLLLNKGLGVIFVILCLLVMGASCNKGSNSSDESNGQVTTGNLGEGTSTDSTSNAGQDDAREEETSETEENSAQEDEDTVTEDSEEESEEESEEASTDFDWQELGKTSYSTCQACHQANGEGIPSAFPPLKGHITKLYNAEGGRKYIINVVLYGLQGLIEVEDTSYNSAMSPQSFFSDEQIAAVLNHELNSWGNDELLEEFNPILTK